MRSQDRTRRLTPSPRWIFAAIGAAVGLGNIWRFAYLAGENGGAFLLVNLLIALALGVPLVVVELTIGKRGAGYASV